MLLELMDGLDRPVRSRKRHIAVQPCEVLSMRVSDIDDMMPADIDEPLLCEHDRPRADLHVVRVAAARDLEVSIAERQLDRSQDCTRIRHMFAERLKQPVA